MEIAKRIVKVEAITLIPSILMSAFYSLMFARDMMFDLWYGGLYDSIHKKNFPVDAFFSIAEELFLKSLPCIAIMAVVVAIVIVIVTVYNNKKT